MEPKTRKEHYLAKIAGEDVTVPEPKTIQEHYLKEIAENGGGDLPSASWTATVSTGFEAQDVTAEVNNVEFTKTSNTAFTHDQLVGAVFEMGGNTIVVTEEMLTDMSPLGITGTMINLPNFGNVVFSATATGGGVTEKGCYLATAAISYAPLVTMSYTETLTAETRAIAFGTMEMTDGVTALPSGVIYLQVEG